MVNAGKYIIHGSYGYDSDVTTSMSLDLFDVIFLAFYHGKSPVNHNLGEYVWNFFHASKVTQIQSEVNDVLFLF